MDPKLLNKLQAIKTLRDRAGTEGERDAAQHKLTIIMAKHKLTEQDIPSDSFSTRGRTTTSNPFSHKARTRYDDFRAEKFQEDFWDDLDRKFQDLRNEPSRPRERTRQPPPQDKRKAPDSSNQVSMKTSQKVQWRGKLLYSIGDALGYAASRSISLEDESQIIWTVFSHMRISQTFIPLPYPDFTVVRILTDSLMRDLKVLCVTAKGNTQPSNPNAFDRAFYEEATHVIRERLAKACGYSPVYHSSKAKNPQGITAGKTAGMHVSLYPVA